MLLLLCGCGAETATDAPVYTSLADLESGRIGVTMGSIQAMQAEARFPDAEIYYFSTTVDCLGALKAGNIDAFADAEAIVRYMMAENPELTCMEELLAEKMQVAAAFPKTSQGRMLCNQYSEFLISIKQNGVYDEVLDTWFGPDESRRAVPNPFP